MSNKDTSGYFWFKTRIDDNDSEFVPNTFWQIVSDPSSIYLIVQICVCVLLPIFVSVVLWVVGECVPLLKTKIERSGMVVDNILLFTSVVGVFLAVLVLAKHVKTQKENSRFTLLYRAKFHRLVHRIRNVFCVAEEVLGHQISSVEQEVNRFASESFTSKKKLGAKKKKLKQEIEDADRVVLEESIRFFNEVCNEVCGLFGFLYPNETIGVCLRMGQIETTSQLLEYATMGRSHALDNRVHNTEAIRADEGIAKFISDGIIKDTANCILAIPSIRHAIDAEIWKKSVSDDDSSIRSVMIVPINYKKSLCETVVSGRSIRLDGLLSITSPKGGDDSSPFSVGFAKDVADVCASIADMLGCFLYRFGQKNLCLDDCRNRVENRTETKPMIGI